MFERFLRSLLLHDSNWHEAFKMTQLTTQYEYILEMIILIWSDLRKKALRPSELLMFNLFPNLLISNTFQIFIYYMFASQSTVT